MNARALRKFLVFSLGLAVIGLASQGAQEPTCQPINPDQPVCLTVIDCEGLQPEENCLGAWTCVEAACIWACEGACSTDDECVSWDGTELYCAKTSGDCEGKGSCEELPWICPDVWAPVCGCNDKTYGNSCEAASAGVNVDYEGKCKTETCWSNDMCATGEYCFFEDCALESGVCEVSPEACPEMWSPVCGCDGETYSNKCFAAIAGTSVDYEGECTPAYCWSNDMCTDDDYCFYAVCAQETGTCLPRPEICYTLYAPVCGCDGETYANDCVAAVAGVSVDHEGECTPVTTICWEDSMCDKGEYCELASCGAKSGACAPRPENCYMIYKPVCGCDGVIYGNDCVAAAAGMTIDYEGACKE